MKPIFLLGVGAQKAGTTFLHRTLRQSPDAAPSEPKEMHVFDAHFLPELAGAFHVRRRQDVIRRLEAEPKAVPAPRSARTRVALRHLLMHYDLGEYVRYFLELSQGKRLTGDITPSYQILGAEHFSTIRRLLAPHSGLRVVFLLRDPVDRIFSAMRMSDRKGEESDSPAHQRFATSFGATQHAIRTDYPRLIRALDAAFPPDEVHCEFYERLFTPAAFSRLLEFLEMPDVRPDFSSRVNGTPVTHLPPPEALSAARAHYAPVYDFCAERFGRDRLAGRWPRLAG